MFYIKKNGYHMKMYFNLREAKVKLHIEVSNTLSDKEQRLSPIF